MHELAEWIEDKGELPIVCPDCGFAWDQVKFYNAIMAGEDITPLILAAQQDAANFRQHEE